MLRHAAWLAQELGAAANDQVRFVGRYTGRAGRELISWAKPGRRLVLDERHRARSDQADLSALTSVKDIEDELARVVGRITRPLYKRFDGFGPPEA